MSALRFADLYSNFLTGEMPSELGQLRDLIILLIHSNMLSGSLSASFAEWNKLQQLDISSNFITGKLSCFAHPLRLLESFVVSDNLLSGPLPVPVMSSPRLSFFNISSNRISGGLVNFNGSNHLEVVDLSENLLSGALSVSGLQLPNLTTVLLYSNCFSGTLPADICDASQLVTLVLDGLSSSPYCLQKPFVLFGVIIPHNTLNGAHGNIPVCIWQMPKNNRLVGPSICSLRARWLASNSSMWL